ncbi:hypothetical protein ASG66_01975 [Bacillus sp. Leaf406]|nr:hypothetical protein ASG66_01975 [Bacillus sp. Leaf406]
MYYTLGQIGVLGLVYVIFHSDMGIGYVADSEWSLSAKFLGYPLLLFLMSHAVTYFQYKKHPGLFKREGWIAVPFIIIAVFSFVFTMGFLVVFFGILTQYWSIFAPAMNLSILIFFWLYYMMVLSIVVLCVKHKARIWIYTICFSMILPFMVYLFMKFIDFLFGI